MPPAEPGGHSTIPPRRWGGNIDCKELVAGSTLWLPIPVDGALLSVGDGHAAQGDGEVWGTAIECPMERVKLTFDVDDFAVRAPVARTRTPGSRSASTRTRRAAGGAGRDARPDGRELGVAARTRVALASVAVDLRVTQIVNEVKGVHAVLRDDAIR